jgi:hypothetical protein
MTCTNHPPFHPLIHPGHPPFVPTGGTESGKVTSQQNIKTVSQSGTAVDHNAVSSPANIDSFALHWIDESQTGACGNMEVGAQSCDFIKRQNQECFASEIDLKNIYEKTRDLNFDTKKIEVAQQMWVQDLEEFATVIYVQIQNKVLNFNPRNKKTYDVISAS